MPQLTGRTGTFSHRRVVPRRFSSSIPRIRAALLLSPPLLDGYTHQLLLYVPISVSLRADKALENGRDTRANFVRRWFSVREPMMALLELGQALPARVAKEEALHCGRCGIDADSYTHLRLDARARGEKHSHCRRSFRNHDLHVCVSCHE